MSDNKPCVHCGADCGKSPVVWDNKPFCCNGCKQVYQLLHEHQLNKYYSFDTNPGIRVENTVHDSKYAFLDRDDVKEKLYVFHENNTARVSFYIPGIHCASCIWLLEHLNKLNKGIIHSAVDFVKKEFTVNFNTEEISLRQIVELLVSIHYTPDISLKTIDKKDITSVDKKLMYKIGVAGFAFGNVMLYSLPEYFSGKSLEGSLGIFLSYLSLILVVPVVFYSGIDYIVSAIKNLKRGIVNIDLPIAIGILTLFTVTIYEIVWHAGSGYADSLAGFLFFLLIGRWYQSKTYQSLSFDRDYKSYFPVAVTQLEKGEEKSTLLEEISIDDILLIRNKELIPADSILVDGTALIDYSFVTGESTPIQKDLGEPLYAGGVQTGGAIIIKVLKEVKQSHLTQLWNQSETKSSSSQHTKRTLVSLIDKISVWFTLAIISISILGVAFWLTEGDFSKAILVFTSVLIVACPCALALSAPFTFGNAMRILGANGMYLKNTEIVEKLTKINTLVFDKTGTLTVPDESKIEFLGMALSDFEECAIASLARQSAHPLSNALSKHLSDKENLKTTGFVEVAGRGVFAVVKGKEIMLGSSEYVGNTKEVKQNTSTSIYIKINNEIKGYYKISNSYRKGFSKVITLFRAQYELYLLSGDNDAEKENLKNYFDADKMHFNQQPIDKMNFIEELHKQGKNVLMTGDGLNDAGAFLKSDVALSIADDIYHFSPAGDAIIEASKFNKLNNYIRYAQKALVIVKFSFLISFLYNIVGIAFALTGNLSPVVAAILMPISSISVVAFATFSTNILAKRIL